MKATIAVIAGDGIGPEVVDEGTRVLERVARKFGHEFTMSHAPFGGAAIDLTGDPLPAQTLELCLAADAVLLGAIGGPKWGPSSPVRPEQGLLRIRRELGVYANLRPIKVHAALRDASALKPAYQGAPTVILGPGELALAHQTDEYCLVDRVQQAVEVYAEIGRRWCRL